MTTQTGKVTMISRIDFNKKSFVFHGKSQNGLNSFVLEVVQYVCGNESYDFDTLKKKFPDELQNNRPKKGKDSFRYGVFTKKSEIAKKHEKRYFYDSVIQLSDNTEIVVCSQWGQMTKAGHQNFNTFVDYALNELKLSMEIIYN